MSINLSEVFTTFATKYNKKNIISYVSFLFILCILAVFAGISSPIGVVVFCLTYFLISAIYIGYYVVTSHNEANNTESAFPSINELGRIIKEGIKFSVGISLVSFIVYSIPIAIIVFLGINAFKDNSSDFYLTFFPLIFVFFIITFLLSYFIVLRLQIIYLTTLKFSDFFAFKKLPEFKRQKGNQFLIFFLFTILVNISISIVASSFSFITVIAGIISKIDNIQFFTNVLSFFVTISLYNLLIPNLNGQIAKYDVANEPKLEDYELYDDSSDDEPEEDNEKDV